MKYDIMTLFPEMFPGIMETSILGRGVSAGLIRWQTWNIRDYTEEKHGKVDDYPYGGGAGMVMQVQPVYSCFQKIVEENGKRPSRVIYLTPQGRVFDQYFAKELAKEEELVFLCGHYEGVDERIVEELVTDQVSIGDYVLTGGELPAMVMMDTIARLVPGVLGNQESADTESFSDGLLEYPQYSRPFEILGRKVPEVLLSGNHQKIAEWRLEKARERTKKSRPDLYEKWKEKTQ